MAIYLYPPVTLTTGAIQYSRKSGGVTSATTVLEDLDSPTNSRGMPVVIHSIDGAPINITAGDLNVQLSDRGSNPDATRVGDGTNIMGVNSNLEALVHDAGLLTQSTTTNTNLGAQADSVATTDTGSFSLIAFVKRSLQNWTSLLAKMPALVGGKIPVDVTGEGLALDASIIQSQGTVTNGTAATKSTMIGGIYNATPPTLTTGQQAAIQLDTAGNQKVTITNTVNISGANVEAAQNATAASKSDLCGGVYNSAAPTLTSGNQSAMQLDINGNLKAILTNASIIKAQLQDNAGTAIVLGQQVVTSSVPVALSSRHEAVATPLAMRQSDGTNFLASIALTATQLTSGAITSMRTTMGVMMGWDGATHREIAVDTSGNTKMATMTSVGTVTSAKISVGTTAVRATVTGTAASASRKRLSIKPAKANTGLMFLGSSSVTTASGIEILGPDRIDFIMDGSDYYLISDSAGQSVEILESI